MMVLNEKTFKPEYAIELFKIALADHKTASFLARSPDTRRENALFHVEQAVEKALKAVLCSKGIAVPFTHDLYAIVQRFADKGLELPPFQFALHDLTPYASIRRYEEGIYELSQEDVDEALTISVQVLKWAESFVGS